MTQQEARRQVVEAWKAFPPQRREVPDAVDGFVIRLADGLKFRARQTRYAVIRDWIYAAV